MLGVDVNVWSVRVWTAVIRGVSAWGVGILGASAWGVSTLWNEWGASP